MPHCAAGDNGKMLRPQRIFQGIKRTLQAMLRPNSDVATLAAPPAALAPDLAGLLRRPAVDLDTPQLQRFLAGKVVLVTGAGGSIGSEICRQVMKFCPARLVLVERTENNLFEIDRELRQAWLGADILPYVADVGDKRRIAQIFELQEPQVVLHCAAHKHVPMMEINVGEAIKNNIVGTKIVADAALAAGSQAFVLVSTDKAVNPTSVMGAAKRFAELYVQGMGGAAQDSGPRTARLPHDISSAIHSQEGPRTRFAAVRFGNVLGSSGSVVPIFLKQIAAGGPVTVTHPDMRRYFMTIPEASQLVLQCGAMGRGGEVFILDMGDPIRILDLAHELIRRCGLRAGRDIAIEFTGIRPGEKLYEELSTKIRVWQLPPVDMDAVEENLAMLVKAANTSDEAAMAALARCVPEYRSAALPSGAMPAIRAA
jgi:FlaA1/EpsC-like NDP-sugar epimerase